MNHKQTLVALSILCVALQFSCAARQEQRSTPDAPTPAGSHAFTDDEGALITFDAPFRRIIVLYPAHGENLFAIGAGSSVIGVARGTDYPAEAAALPAFDYNGDPEYVIAQDPDLVLIRPFVRRHAPDYVAELEKAGIPVVSLYPETLEDFDTYIMRLGELTGKDEEAAAKLKDFWEAIRNIEQQYGSAPNKKNVFIEVTETEIRTAAASSLPARAIEFAGGNNVTPRLQPMTPGGSIARFGAEALLAIGDQVDIYVIQQGTMNPVSTVEALQARPGFSAVKAVREGKALFINEKLISSVTFRYLEGVKLLADFLHPAPGA